MVETLRTQFYIFATYGVVGLSLLILGGILYYRAWVTARLLRALHD